MIETKYMASSVVSVNPIDLQQLSKVKFGFRNIILYLWKILVMEN